MQSGVRQEPILVDLALQGGGAHGAFTWGVLDRLLEEPSLQIEGISGTSAGAMNAAVLARGSPPAALRAPDRARAILAAGLRRGAHVPFQRSPLDILLGRWTLDNSPVFLAMDLMARIFSPYDLNPTRRQSVARDPGALDRLQAPGRGAGEAVRHGDQRA